MIDLLQQILGVISQTYQFLLNVLESLVLAMAFISNSIGFVGSFTFMLNPFLSASMLAAIAIGVIKFLLGR